MSEPRGRRDNAFALVRLVLAALVIVAHAPELLDGDRHRELLTRAFGAISFGELAVDGFFALSGFLLAQSWQKSPHLVRYLARRVLRIHPGFLLAFAVSVLGVGTLGAANPRDYFAALDPAKLLPQALTLGMPMTPSTFVGTFFPDVNGAMWTIRYEFLCYLSIPMLGLVGLLHRPRALVLVVAVALAASFATPEIMHATGLHAEEGLGRHVARALWLGGYYVTGACAATWVDRLPLRGDLAFLATVVLAACLALLGKRGEALAAPAAVYVLIYAGESGLAFAKHAFRETDVSYGTYLYAWPIAKLLIAASPGISPWVLAASTLPLSLGAGWLSWILVERPVLRRSGAVVALLSRTKTSAGTQRA